MKCPNTVFHRNLEEGIETGICSICKNKGGMMETAERIFNLIRPALKKEHGEVAGMEIYGYMTNKGMCTKEGLIENIDKEIRRNIPVNEGK